jgi:hypothetical protein
VGELRVQDLDRDAPFDLDVLTLVDGTHPSVAELSQDPIAILQHDAEAGVLGGLGSLRFHDAPEDNGNGIVARSATEGRHLGAIERLIGTSGASVPPKHRTLASDRTTTRGSARDGSGSSFGPTGRCRASARKHGPQIGLVPPAEAPTWLQHPC